MLQCQIFTSQHVPEHAAGARRASSAVRVGLCSVVLGLYRLHGDVSIASILATSGVSVRPSVRPSGCFARWYI